MSVGKEQGRFIGNDKNSDPRPSKDKKQVRCVEGGREGMGQ